MTWEEISSRNVGVVDPPTGRSIGVMRTAPPGRTTELHHATC